MDTKTQSSCNVSGCSCGYLGESDANSPFKIRFVEEQAPPAKKAGCTCPGHDTQPYVCPVCMGRGKIQDTFYSLFGASSTIGVVTCQSCWGTGVLWR
jgi:hypothetical protein